MAANESPRRTGGQAGEPDDRVAQWWRMPEALLAFVWQCGYQAAERDMAAAWKPFADSVIAKADPGSPQGRQAARMRVFAAEEGCRADARAHWHQFMRCARALPQAVLDDIDPITGDPSCPAPVRAAAEMQGRKVTWKWQLRKGQAA